MSGVGGVGGFNLFLCLGTLPLPVDSNGWDISLSPKKSPSLNPLLADKMLSCLFRGIVFIGLGI